MDVPLLAAVFQQVNNRLMDDLAFLRDATPVGDFISKVTSHVVTSGRRLRALEPIGKDLEFLQTINNPLFKIPGVTNKMLREHLVGTGFGTRRTEKQLSAKISRHLRMFRAHGIIRKLPPRKISTS